MVASQYGRPAAPPAPTSTCARSGLASGLPATTRIVAIDDPNWSSYVAHHPEATVFHRPDWADVVSTCYRFTPFALIATVPGGGVVGGVPIMQVRHPLRRPAWITLPFSDHVPVLADDAARRMEVVAGLREFAEAAHVRRLTLRDGVGAELGRTVGIRHVLQLSGGTDELQQQISSGTRSSIRRARRDGVTVREGTTQRDVTEIFYRLQLLTRRRHGLPVQPLRFFRLLHERILAPGHGTLLIAEYDGAPIAVALTLHHNRTTVGKYAASDPSHWRLRPNHLLCWESIEGAHARGSAFFDFGRSELGNEGLRRYKGAWGGEELPLVYTELGDGGWVEPRGTGRAIRATGAILRTAPPWVCRAAGTALYRFAA